MAILPFNWKRQPPWNCPICQGTGKMVDRLYSNVPPQEWQCIGRKRPKPPKKKGALKIVETELSKAQRESWMEHAARLNNHCLCVAMSKLDYTVLRRTAAHIQRIIHNERPKQHDLDDPLDDMFPGPYIHPEFLK